MCGPEVEDTENTAEEMLCISKGKINSFQLKKNGLHDGFVCF